ncbi:hypothetical protein NEOKW01_0053 [Nematocida sp. AWRm80]|nr:hypothetical protein NEOKW01_0053 [Nematocida sp. AWRm80]
MPAQEKRHVPEIIKFAVSTNICYKKEISNQIASLHNKLIDNKDSPTFDEYKNQMIRELIEQSPKTYLYPAKLSKNPYVTNRMIWYWTIIISHIIEENKTVLQDTYNNLIAASTAKDKEYQEKVLLYNHNRTVDTITNGIENIYESFLSVFNSGPVLNNLSGLDLIDKNLSMINGINPLTAVSIRARLNYVIAKRNSTPQQLQNQLTSSLYTPTEIFSLPWANKENILLEDHIDLLLEELSHVDNINALTEEELEKYKELESIIVNYSTISSIEYMQSISSKNSEVTNAFSKNILAALSNGVLRAYPPKRQKNLIVQLINKDLDLLESESLKAYKDTRKADTPSLFILSEAEASKLVKKRVAARKMFFTTSFYSRDIKWDSSSRHLLSKGSLFSIFVFALGIIGCVCAIMLIANMPVFTTSKPVTI